jgi:preprotein translocase subunit YajC
VSALPWIVLAVLLIGMFFLTQRNRQRAAAAEARRRETIGFGSRVMTTSGLYGTVTGMNDDDTVQLAIAPGVEVQWALAALRDAESLPTRYRQGVDQDAESSGSEEPPEDGRPI